MNIFVDIGNTRLKWRTSEGHRGGVTHRGASPEQVIAQAWVDLPQPDSVWVACVAGEEVLAALRWYVAAHWSGAALRVLESVAQCCGVSVAYRQPRRFGVDRLAALVAAHELYPARPLVVVDAGTAVTVDALSAHGEHLGGLIMPGKGMLASGLDQGVAANLGGEGEGFEDTDRLPMSTAGSVHAGVTAMYLGGVLHGVDLALRVAGRNAQLVLTGGDASQLAGHLSDGVLEPDLVLAGVERMAAEHVALHGFVT